jgi:uncharacterized membrane protein (UPF0127 family)
MRAFFILLTFISIIPACAQGQQKLVIHSASSDYQVKVVVVTRSDEMARGLMYRRSLGKDSGMLFIFQREEPQSFWMKNTLIPLDMIFISRNLVIVDITTMQPCITNPCPDYTSRQPAQYVLEVNAGFCRNHHIIIGDKVSSDVLR